MHGTKKKGETPKETMRKSTENNLLYLKMQKMSA